MTHVGELAGHGLWRSVGAWLWAHLPARARAFLRARFGDVSRSEAWGYAVWGAMGIVVGVPEIWAAASGDDFYWPTISSTVGHLEDLVAVIAVIPVALLAAGAYSVFRYKPGEVSVQADMKAVGRTPEGRLTKTDPSFAELAAAPAQVLDSGRKRVAALPYFAGATLTVIVGSLVGARANDKWILAYVLYGLIALLWIVVPNVFAYFRETDIPFTTLVVTVRCLERRLHTIALLFAGGIAILLIHLALYPWPDLARSSASYAGLTPGKAEAKAKRELAHARAGKPELTVTTKERAVADGRNVWFVYFAPENGTYRGCVVTVTKKTASVAPQCRA